MATSRDYAEYVKDKLQLVCDFNLRSMMGEYLIYYQGKIIGGLCDNNLLLKQTKAINKYLTDIRLVSPYSGAKEMVLVHVEECQYLKALFDEMYLELPESKSKK